MGRQLRMIPPGWEHPKDDKGRHIPLMQGPYSEVLEDWKRGDTFWRAGLREDFAKKGEWKKREGDELDMTYTEWAGHCPRAEDYMPEWPADQCTLFVMYEDTSEGTPISPPFQTAEALARWLADTGASAFGDMTATYDQWLATIKRGWAVCAIGTGGRIVSGVEAQASL